MGTSNFREYSIKYIYIADSPSDGATMPEESAMTLIGHNIKPDSASIEKEDDTFNSFKNQEDNTTDFEVMQESGATTFNFETWDLNTDNLILALGGSVVSGKWLAPVNAYAGKEVCLKIVSKDAKGMHAVSDFPRVKMKGKMVEPLTNGDAASLMFSFTVLTPENASGVKQSERHMYNKPTAPTNPVTNDTANTFGWTYVEGFETATLYEYSTDTGLNYAACTVNPQTGITGNVGVGALLVRVKANTTSTNKNVAGYTLANTEAFAT